MVNIEYELPEIFEGMLLNDRGLELSKFVGELFELRAFISLSEWLLGDCDSELGRVPPIDLLKRLNHELVDGSIPIVTIKRQAC